MLYQEDLERAKSNFKENQKFLKNMKRTKPKNLDEQFHKLHDEVFKEIDCLECANCCKTTSPIFLQADIDRVAKALKMKSGDFIIQYLEMDEDGDFVLKSAPCPFLGSDNKCIVYKDRPRACKEYPHTDRKRMYQIMDLTLQNTLVCPAVSRIVEKMRESTQ